MQHIWSILCKESFVDSNTNNISLIGTIEQLNFIINKKKVKKINEVKALPFDMVLVNLWYDENIKKDRKFKIFIELIDPENKKVSTYKAEHLLAKGKKRIRVQTKFNGIITTISGKYLLRVMYQEKGQQKLKKAIEIPLDISIAFK